MSEVVVASLDSDAELLAGLLSADERHRAGRFAFARERRRYIVARARLRQLLGERLGAAPESLRFVYNPHGKPALARCPGQRDLRFNVSHCGGVAAYAFAEGREVGVDIEEVCELPDADDIAMRLFSHHERGAYLRLSLRERPQGFFNCWTRKEAFLKALGEGLRHHLDRCEVSLAPGEPARILRFGEIPGDACGWVLEELSLGPGLAGALVAQDLEAQSAGAAGPP
jgi:4'-phosphopantetheinyl transferase